MLSVRPRELRLVIQHHEAAMMTISCSSFSFSFVSTSPRAVHFVCQHIGSVVCSHFWASFYRKSTQSFT